MAYAFIVLLTLINDFQFSIDHIKSPDTKGFDFSTTRPGVQQTCIVIRSRMLERMACFNLDELDKLLWARVCYSGTQSVFGGRAR